MLLKKSLPISMISGSLRKSAAYQPSPDRGGREALDRDPYLAKLRARPKQRTTLPASREYPSKTGVPGRTRKAGREQRGSAAACQITCSGPPDQPRCSNPSGICPCRTMSRAEYLLCGMQGSNVRDCPISSESDLGDLFPHAGGILRIFSGGRIWRMVLPAGNSSPLCLSYVTVKNSCEAAVTHI